MEEIVFDVEQPQFEIKAGVILLEVILPVGSAANDSYYIVGDFNGGSAAVGNPAWQLEKAAASDSKWGIYLDPASFATGKTLADGFYFVSAAQGEERSVKNEPIKHTLNAAVGTRSNIFVDRWAKYFDAPTDTGGHDGHVVYIQNTSAWTALALYGWKDGMADTDIFGGWPGKQPDGTEVINGMTFTYFDLTEAKADLTGINVIVNNNNGGSQFDVATIDFNRDYYYRLTDVGISAIDPNASYRLYVDNLTGWDALTLSLGGADWPGMEPAGTTEVNGITYTYFETAIDLMGQNLELWFNNGKETGDPGVKQSVTKQIIFSRDYYFMLTADGIVEVDPATHRSYNVYVDNTAWNALALYGYNDVGGQLGNAGWPGIQPTGTAEINGVTFTHFLLSRAENGKSYNFIFNNNNGGSQFDAPAPVTIDHDVYYAITADGIEEIDPNSYGKSYSIYVDDRSGWGALTLYGWGDGGSGDLGEAGWPGVQPEADKVSINGTDYLKFVIPASSTGKAYNLIFNNNGGGLQFDGPNITLNRDYYFRITDTTCEEPPAHIYVDDQTGWDALALYAWGEAEFAGWPGILQTDTKEVAGVTYKHFDVSAYTLKNVNLIFNNNGAGTQFDGPYVLLLGDMYFRATAGSCEVVPRPE
jgi:hypothetical protein